MARALKPLTLPLGELAPSPQRGSPPAVSKPQLWVAVRLPELVLQAVSSSIRSFAEEAASCKAGDPKAGSRKVREDAESSNTAERAERAELGRPVAVVEPCRGRLFVAAVDSAARSLGIEPGLSLSAAFGFSGSLRVIERSPQAESAHLEAAAACCSRFTPLVSIEPPDSLLLEVQASLRLFGGLEAIKTSLANEIRRGGFTVQLAAAPTPLGALWLVRGGGKDASSLERLQSLAKPLPLEVTHWPASIQTLLADMGVRTLGDCLRLPRAGFARRVGPDYLHELDKALGRLFDPRSAFSAPEVLSFQVELFEQTADLATLAAAAGRMTEALAAELRRRQAEVLCLELVLEHLRRPPTVLSCELVEPAHEARRFAELLCDKLERTSLPVPAAAVRLSAGPLLVMRPPAEADLFNAGRRGSAEASPLRLIERLRTRLGAESVYGLAPAADHRPEKAWRKIREPARAFVAGPSGPCERPLWLLPVPQKLSSASEGPSFNGLLRLNEGPERIESGWWDGEGVDKDYFTASNEGGQKLWVYFDRRRGAWYLHGFFA